MNIGRKQIRKQGDQMSRIGSIVMASAAALLLTGVVHAGPVQAAAKSCNLGFMPTKPTVGIGTIIGTAWVECDVPPDAHHLDLALEQFQGGSWNPIGTSGDNVDRIPQRGRREVYQVKVPCTSGYWRVRATASGILDGHSFNFTDKSMETSITDDQCNRGN